MKSILSKILSKELQRSMAYLVGLILVRAGIQITLFKQGFISVAADEFARGILAAKWATDPRIDILADVQGTWLPFEKYLNGFFLVIFPDVILTPRVTVFIASCLLIVVVYFLTYYLFDRFAIAVITTLFITFQPWYVWLSGTPMLEMYYFTFFFAGFLFIIVWLKEARQGYWFWAGACFLVTSGFHVQSWTLINLVNLSTLPWLYCFSRQKEYKNLAKLIVYYVLSNGLIIGFALIEFFDTGQIFAFLSNHTSYSKWYYDGYDVSVIEKFLYYPKLVVQNSSAIIWICLAIALVFLIRDQERRWKLFPLLLAISALFLNSFANIFSGPPSAAPPRYSLFHVIILSLYLGYGIYHLFTLKWKDTRQLTIYASKVLAVVLFLYGIWWGAYRIPDYPLGMSVDAVEVGRNLNMLLNENPGVYMVELRYWDFLAVNLTSHHYDNIIFDREQNIRDRDTPSIFLQERDEVCKSLALPDLQYVVLKDKDLKLLIQELNLVRLHQNVGMWTIYEVVPEFEHAIRVCS